MTWCEEFVSSYRRTPADRLSAYYDDRTSVLVETIVGDGGWTRPTVGAANVADRLAQLNAIGDEWPVETCQRTRTGNGLLVVMSDGRARRQILIVHQTAAASVVTVHFYHDGNTVVTPDDDDNGSSSFQTRFQQWAASLDRTVFEKFRTAFHVGLTVARQNYYASPNAGDRNARWRQYDRVACKFSCSRNGRGGDRVYTGVQSVRKGYGRMEFRHAKLRTLETCWYGTTAVVLLAAGTVPGDRQFVQFFIVDSRTRKILNDVLCVQQWPLRRSCRLSSISSSSSLSSSSSSSSSSSPSSWPFSSTDTDDDDEPTTAEERVAIRSRLAANLLTDQCTAQQHHKQPYYNNNSNGILNPRQLFIGCVPLHVKYGQLKLLFERFGEVTYVKVYDGYNKQTGAKMLHNYAFLFFKDEVSVEKAIAASPIPLDSNWTLNVSRPHHHLTTTAAAYTSAPA